jgi:CDP-glycerol glycerophosphotransferase
MPLLSVVLPVYKVQGYLRQCLDSLLDQSFTDFEIVAVDDRSPDHSGAILAEYAARDPRVRVLSLPENVGLGRARNAGLAQATGDFVWFVDSDDWLAADSLAAVAERIRQVSPDVLMVGFDRVHWDGEVVAGRINAALAAAPETFTAEQWPRALSVLHVAWNKIVRRDLLVKLGFQFEQGWYEDVSFTFPILVAAQRISALPLTCVHYRQRRTGAITRTVGDRHFEIFEHWAHAFALIDEYSERAEAIRPMLFNRMMWHLLVVLHHPERVPLSSKRRFFARMHEFYQRFVPAEGYERPDGGQGLRHKLVARGNFVGFEALESAARVVRASRRAWRRFTGGFGRAERRLRLSYHDLYYRLHLRLPVDPSLALYAAYWYRGVACNPAAIAAKAAELAPQIRPVWVVNRAGAEALPSGTEHVVAGTLAYFRALARARWLVNNVNWPNRVVKRSGTTHVMTHHGTPLKIMGLDQLEHPAAVKDADFAAQLRRADRWDFSISANAHSTVAWERAYPCEYETLEVGYPRNDRLAVATPAETSSVREQLGIAPTQRVVLYAPTHREWLPANEPVLDVEELAKQLGPDTVLLVRAHYFHVPAGAAAHLPTRDRIIDVSAYRTVEDLYLAADVMITDYSSAMFDYAVLDRPIVIHAPDWTVYREVRGVYFDLMAQPPGAVTTTGAELAETFATGAYKGAVATAARAAFRARFCYLDDGHAAERVVRRVLLGESGK